MPIYVYKCYSCEHVFEELRVISQRHEPTENPCPNCSEEGNIETQIQAAAITSSDGNFLSKVPDGFKDRLRDMKKLHGSSCTIDV